MSNKGHQGSPNEPKTSQNYGLNQRTSKRPSLAQPTSHVTQITKDKETSSPKNRPNDGAVKNFGETSQITPKTHPQNLS